MAFLRYWSGHNVLGRRGVNKHVFTLDLFVLASHYDHMDQVSLTLGIDLSSRHLELKCVRNQIEGYSANFSRGLVG